MHVYRFNIAIICPCVSSIVSYTFGNDFEKRMLGASILLTWIIENSLLTFIPGKRKSKDSCESTLYHFIDMPEGVMHGVNVEDCIVPDSITNN